MTPQAQIIESRVICRQPGRYIGWPTIAKAADGELFVVFSGDRDAHVDPFGKTCFMKSSDRGATWSDAVVITDTPLDDRDAGICVAPDGSLVVSWFTSHYDDYLAMEHYCQGEEERWKKALSQVSEEDVVRWTHAGSGVAPGRRMGFWTRRSSDRGEAWEDPVPSICCTPHGPISLSDGRLLFVGKADFGREEGRAFLGAAESRDDGRSWELIGRINALPEYGGDAEEAYAYLCEPHAIEVAPDRIVAMARYEERGVARDARRPSMLWQFESGDGGRTWTEPRRTDIVGKPPHLTRLSDGRILLTYGYRHDPYGQRACLSSDGGQTWDYDNEIILRDDAPNGDLGYPASVECDDGTILTVYYQKETLAEKTVLMTTRWRV
ncbi:MAG: sialidase family protein [Armatimonadota bacterium]|nr:sialidase family protein [Armatimonadota bacterium]